MSRRALVFLIVLLALAAALFWLWSSDYVLEDKCLDAGGRWDAGQRTCMINADRFPASLSSPRR